MMSSDLSQSFPDIVILDPEDSGYFGLSEVAGRVWQLLEEPKSYTQLYEALLTEYDTSKELLQSDLNEFLSKLLEKKILISGS